MRRGSFLWCHTGWSQYIDAHSFPWELEFASIVMYVPSVVNHTTRKGVLFCLLSRGISSGFRRMDLVLPRTAFFLGCSENIVMCLRRTMLPRGPEHSAWSFNKFYVYQCRKPLKKRRFFLSFKPGDFLRLSPDGLGPPAHSFFFLGFSESIVMMS